MQLPSMHLGIVRRVGLEDVIQGQLPWPLSLLVVDVPGVRPVQVAHDLCVLRRLRLVYQSLEDACRVMGSNVSPAVGLKGAMIVMSSKGLQSQAS